MTVPTAERGRLNQSIDIKRKSFTFREHETSYLHRPASTDGQTTVCVHGFGGSGSHFRKQLNGQHALQGEVFAIDLLGYGASDKPPAGSPPASLYNFDTWSDQLNTFVSSQVKRKPISVVANSIGCLVALEAAIKQPDNYSSLILLNMSLRKLHVENQNPVQRVAVPLVQQFLRETPVGPYFFEQVKNRPTLRKILREAYAGKPDAVDDELLELILEPAKSESAAQVFLDFISFSGGPLPEQLLKSVKVPTALVWGEEDPWEPLDEARELFEPHAEKFYTIKNGGHCPMDCCPEETKRIVERFQGEVLQT